MKVHYGTYEEGTGEKRISKLEELAHAGQSVWMDYIRRAFIVGGDLQRMIDIGLRGITSNPTIFEKAIAGSPDYDATLKELAGRGKTPDEIFEILVLEDIGRAADLFLPVYQATNGADGFVSLEVSPTLAHDTKTTISEARRLFGKLNRPNVMIKVPATMEGIPAVGQLIGEGTNINITLMFSLDDYRRVAEAYLEGLERLQASRVNPGRVSSVASIFVSRVDTMVDKELSARGIQELQGKIAIANAKMIYQEFLRTFSGPRWEKLAKAGARIQRVLWASTGTKNPLYPDTMYIDQLVGPNTINTIPPATLTAYLDHGITEPSIEKDLTQAKYYLERLEASGIDLNVITKNLQTEGVESFVVSFRKLMEAIEQKTEHILAERKELTLNLNSYMPLIESAQTKLRKENIVHRIWERDYTIWKSRPDEITNRLGWLLCPEVMKEQVGDISSFVDEIRSEGITNALLLGMGGSSLAPEVFRRVFGAKKDFPDLSVLDSTAPGAVLSFSRNLDPKKTLYIVSTKSGGTVETMSFLKYFYNRALKVVGAKEAGRRFIAITDPGSGLQALAESLNFRKIFLNDPNIGGRYSALSHFGLVPAGLIGVDLSALLERAHTMACNSEGCNSPIDSNNSGATLGVILGQLALNGRDKLTFVISKELEPFGPWVEQLIAESTGKEGTGILPVVGEEVLPAANYANDRLFVYLRLKGDSTYDTAVEELQSAGRPVVWINLEDKYALGAEFFRWEMATAIAGYFLKINPFDQPNVEAAKVLARRMVAAYYESGQLPESEPSLKSGNVSVFSEGRIQSIERALPEFLEKAEPGDARGMGRSYAAIQAFINPEPEVEKALQLLRTSLQKKYRMAVTVGFGPRFLHSTGQLHKGDGGKGRFIQITGAFREDVPIPNEAGKDVSSMTFGILARAQALGDLEALKEAGRKVIRFHLSGDIKTGIEKLNESIK